ncbi:MAG: hypothetical protein R2754_10480 [Microthrixaceae bacterium]
MKRAKRGIVVLVGMLALSACGGSDGSDWSASETTAGEPTRELTAEDTEYVEAIGAAAAERDESQKGPPAEELDCWAETMVNAVPASKLTKAGLDPDKVVEGQVQVGDEALSDAEAEAVVDAFVDCIDLKAVLMPTEDDDAPEGVAECMDQLDWDELERPFVEGMILSPEDEEASAKAMQPINECIMGAGVVESPGQDAPEGEPTVTSAPADGGEPTG